MRKHYIFLTLLALVVLTGLIIGFITGGNPTDLKAINNDEINISALSTVRYSIDNYFQKNLKLPQTLADLELTPKSLNNRTTQKPFTYNKITETSYTLCTEFATDTTEIENRYDNMDVTTTSPKHKKGYDCIEYKVTAPAKVSNAAREKLSSAISEYPITLKYSKLHPLSTSSGADMGQITTADNLTLRIGPQSQLKVIQNNAGYFLFVIKVVPTCPKESTYTCVFSPENLSLKTNTNVTIVKNTIDQPLYTAYVGNTYGEMQTTLNISPNESVDGYLAYHIPVYLLQQNVPIDLFMSYEGSEALKLTLTRN